MKKQKFTYSIITVLAISVFLLFYMRPISLASNFVWKNIEGVYVVKINRTLREHGELDVTTTDIELKPQQEQFVQLQSLFEQYDYHACLCNVFNSDNLQRGSNVSWALQFSDGTVFTLVDHGIFLGNRHYCIDYLGDQKITELFNDLDRIFHL